MIDRPVLFNGDMVRSILADLKTNTRRPINPQPTGESIDFEDGVLKESLRFAGCWHVEKGRKHIFGQPGDQLWVREKTKVIDYDFDSHEEVHVNVEYVADGTLAYCEFPEPLKAVKEGHCMPNGCNKHAHRIDLLVKRVWVERVQDISEKDAKAEGVDVGSNMYHFAHRDKFIHLWDSIYKAKGFGWDANPWVWACEFEKIV